jgi:hypothetical protein
VLNKEGRFERLRESTKGSIILFSNMVSLNCLKKINNTQGFIFLKRTTGNRSKNDGCQPKVPRVEKNGYQLRLSFGKLEKIACMIGLFMRVKTVRGRLVV